MAEKITREQFLKEWQETQERLTMVMAKKKAFVDTMNLDKKKFGIIYKNAYNAFKVEDYVQAEKLFFSLFLMDFKDYSFQIGLGATYEALEKFENALSMYSFAMMMGKNKPELLFRSGKCLLAIGKKNEAGIMFELAAESKDNGLNRTSLGAIEKSKKILALLTD